MELNLIRLSTFPLCAINSKPMQLHIDLKQDNESMIILRNGGGFREWIGWLNDPSIPDGVAK